jgi:selenide,water dikinase
LGTGQERRRFFIEEDSGQSDADDAALASKERPEFRVSFIAPAVQFSESFLASRERQRPEKVLGSLTLTARQVECKKGVGDCAIFEVYVMQSSTAPVPIEKNVVLVGGGNAHLVFVKRFGMRPMPGVAVTLVNEAAVIPYSAMVPAHIGGDYSWDEITIDLVRLCQLVKVRFIAERVTAIEPRTRQVRFADRPALTYDVLSLGVGSLPAYPPSTTDDGSSLVMRPLNGLLRQLDALEKQLSSAPGPFHLVVVGGGASGCELALAIGKRLGKISDLRLTLLQGDARLLPEFPRRVAGAFERAFVQQGIAHRVDARVMDRRDGFLLLESGEKIAHDAVLWATRAAPPQLLRASGLAVDAAGFLRVRDTLQSVTDPAVFGTGDCVAFESYPKLPRNGVHAVREGAVLFDNVAAVLHERTPRPFRPQWFCLALLNTADGRAVLTYGGLTWTSRWGRRLKDRIDRAWIRKFTDIAPMAATEPGQPESPLMRCGGCGSKISSDVLSAVLKRIDVPDDPRILLGCRAGEDAAVHRVRPELFGDPGKLVEVQTVDYFKAFVDDPYLFGRIAALNAVSDLYAMNARPFSALAIATLPYARGPVQEGQLYELLSGAVESLRMLGVVLTGGHTTEGSEMALGFSVTGFAEEDRLFQKSKLRLGDVLILTKPLGSGALLAAWMRGQCRATWFAQLVDSMLRPNAVAGAVFARAAVLACTDVTGFGMAGHLLEMLDASRLSARLRIDRVPLYEGFAEVVAEGIVSSLHRDNAKMACRVQAAPAPAWLFDPQTSGGLLAAVRPEAADEIVRQLREDGYPRADVIGEVVAMEEGAPGIYLAEKER